MSMRYKGGVISATPPTTTGGSFGTAPGIWTLEQQMQAQAASTWPLTYDPQFNYVTMLLHGDGTNGGQNNTFLDSSTNNFTITRNGNTTQGSFSPYGSNWSASFPSGTGDYLNTTTNLSAIGTGDFTVEGWWYPNSTGTQEFCLFSVGSVTTANGFAIATDNAQGLFIYSNGYYFDGSAIPTANSWNHIAVTRSSGTTRLYLNGTLRQTITWTNSISAAAVYVGRASNGYFAETNGCISNVRYVNTALYTGSTLTVPTSPLTAVSGTGFLACQSNRFIDNSSNNFTLTVNGSPSVQRFSPFAPSAAYSTATIGGSGYFDGSGDNLSSTGSIQQSGDFTFECWVYRTTAATQILLSIGPETTSRKLFGVWSDGRIFIDNYSGPQYFFGGNVPLNAWSHIAFTRSGSTVTAFYNGVNTGTTNTISGTFGTANLFRIGSDSNGGSSMTGYVTDARLVSGSVLYSANFTPPSSPLSAVSGTVLLTNFTNGSIFDNAMMNDLETVGNAQISTSVKKYGTGSLYFDGLSGTYLQTPASPVIAFGTGDFTIEAWIYNALAAAEQNIAATRTNAGTVNGWSFSVLSNGNIRLYTNSIIVSGGSVPANAWTHVAITRNGTTVRAFVGGVLAATGTSSEDYSRNYLAVGSAQDGTQYPFTGYIDDLRITKGYARYTANFTPPTGAFFNSGPTP